MSINIVDILRRWRFDVAREPVILLFVIAICAAGYSTSAEQQYSLQNIVWVFCVCIFIVVSR